MLELEKIRNALSRPISTQTQGNQNTKLAAVLIVIYGPEPSVIMTERPKTMDHHAGEISFPGGRWEKDDADLLATAIRETREEIGVQIHNNQVIGQLTPVTTLNSGFTIAPLSQFRKKFR
ncbi:putative Nudix hydrolase NudL [Candidatus Nitrosotalea sp. TS]|uniref:NUDIX hydrolase n=1 Tax=Candidatus Nitrosotalea sp. TS TaxID=2341020 RepID=UPI001ED57D3E|nr:CoA pyrophosphatase [Candidatus Nitrosotalea sp. TS]NHI03528.1 putative Nudix hydrolase NudL [Candidatus Nitrosotalea sp. TS]